MHENFAYAFSMSDIGSRLIEARKRAGFATASEAAEALGVSNSTYTQNENGIRGYGREKAERYAKFFRVSPEWLLYGRGSIDDVALLPNEATLETMLRIAVAEIPASASIADWPRLASPILRELLKRYSADQPLFDRAGDDNKQSLPAQSRSATIPGERVQ